MNGKTTGTVLSYDIMNDKWDSNHDPLISSIEEGRAVEIDAYFGLILVASGLKHYCGTKYQVCGEVPQLYNITMNGPVKSIVNGDNGLEGGYSKSMMVFIRNRVMMFGGLIKMDEICSEGCVYTPAIQISNLLAPSVQPSVSPVESINESRMLLTVLMVIGVLLVIIILGFVVFVYYRRRKESKKEMMINQVLIQNDEGIDHQEDTAPDLEDTEYVK